MEFIYDITNAIFGIENIGLSIIVFTVLVNVAMIPLSVSYTHLDVYKRQHVDGLQNVGFSLGIIPIENIDAGRKLDMGLLVVAEIF